MMVPDKLVSGNLFVRLSRLFRDVRPFAAMTDCTAVLVCVLYPDHYTRENGGLRFQKQLAVVEKILYTVPTVRGATEQTGALRFRPAEHTGRFAHARHAETEQPERFRRNDPNAGAEGHERFEVGRSRREDILVAHRGPVRRPKVDDDVVQGTTGGHRGLVLRDGACQPPVLEPEDHPGKSLIGLRVSATVNTRVRGHVADL